MRSSSRFTVLTVLVLGLVALWALPALAKGAPGEDPAVRTVVLFGPNMRDAQELEPVALAGQALSNAIR